jgi:hypothetical protein
MRMVDWSKFKNAQRPHFALQEQDAAKHRITLAGLIVTFDSLR